MWCGKAWMRKFSVYRSDQKDDEESGKDERSLPEVMEHCEGKDVPLSFREDSKWNICHRMIDQWIHVCVLDAIRQSLPTELVAWISSHKNTEATFIYSFIEIDKNRRKQSFIFTNHLRCVDAFDKIYAHKGLTSGSTSWSCTGWRHSRWDHRVVMLNFSSEFSSCFWFSESQLAYHTGSTDVLVKIFKIFQLCIHQDLMKRWLISAKQR